MKDLAKKCMRSAVVVGLVVTGSISAAGATVRTLEGTYIDAGYYGSGGLRVFPNQNTAVGKPIAVTCPGKTGSCTIEADLYIQSGHSNVTRNEYNLCLFVDGNPAPNCQIVGSTPSDYTYADGSTSQLVTGVTPGSHVVQAYFMSYKGASLFNWTSNYRVYKP
jgi:hypothetical protein